MAADGVFDLGDEVGKGEGLRAGKILDETDFYERKDGTILALMRQVMCSAESHDRGETWSDPVDLGFPGHCPYLLMTRSGVLLMAHRLPQTALHYSVDEGRSWQGPVKLDDFIGAYPSMVELKDGRILCVYYEEGPNSAIRALTLKVERKKEGPASGRSPGEYSKQWVDVSAR